MKKQTSISSFEKGIQKDTTKVNQPKGTYRDALNMVNISDQGDMYALTNERGAVNLNILPAGFQIIGKTVLDKEIIVFLVNGSTFELGIIDSSDNYTQVFSSTSFNFSIDFPVNVEARTLFNGDRMVYYTDNNQPFGFFNIDEILNNGAPLPEDSKIIPDIDVPTLSLKEIRDGSGELTAGVYQVVVRYVTKDLVPTNYSLVSDIIPIVDEGKGISWDAYDGAVQGTATAKSIIMELNNIDQSFPFYEIVLIKYSGQTNTFQAFVIDTNPIDSVSERFVISNISEDATELTRAELRVNSITYTQAKCISQKDGRLFLSNLTEDTTRFVDELQSIANNITTTYEVREFDHKTPDSNGEYQDYKSEFMIHDNRGYRRDEVYSFALGVLYKDGSESFAFHIPANDRTTLGNPTASVTVDAVPDNPGSHGNGETGTIGTYISTEEYVGAQYPSVPDSFVRHHKMPSLAQEPHFRNDGGVSKLRVLGVAFQFNTAFSQDLIDEIQDIRIYRERRNTPQNRSIVSQGIGSPLLETDDSYHDKNTSDKSFKYKGAGVDDTELYKKAPAFGGFLINNRAYEGSEPSSTNYLRANGNGLRIDKVGTNGNANFTQASQIAFHSPEIQLANGAFMNEAEAAACKISSDMYIQSNMFFEFQSSRLLQNSLGTRVGFDNFNAMKLLLDFDNYQLDSITPADINYAQRVEHGNSTFIRTDDPLVDNFKFDNKYSSNTMLLDTFGTAITLSDTTFNIDLNEGRGDRTLTSFLPSYIATTGGVPIPNNGTSVYRTRLINLKKDGIVNQYGDIDDSEYIPVKTAISEGDSINDFLVANYQTGVIFGGDTFITKFGISNKNVYSRLMPMRNGTNYTFYNGLTPNPGEAGEGDASNVFFDCKSAIDGNLTRKGEEFHTLAYFFVESNINTELRHEVINEDFDESIPYYPKSSFETVITDPPENGDSEGYNTQYSFENNVRPIFTQSSFVDQLSRYEGRVIYSQLSNEDDRIDSYRIFSQFDKYDLPKNTGPIWNTFIHNNTFYTHTPKSLWRHFVNSISQQATDIGTVVLGTGGLFTQPGMEMLTLSGGYAGCISQFGGIHTPFGYIFPDALQGKMFLLGQTVEEISLQGMSQYFDNNLGTDLTENYIDNPFNPNSAGITGVWDNELKRAIITKRGTSFDFTRSWSPITKSWISEHSYAPHCLVSRDNEFYAFDNTENNIFYQHNRGDYGVFYNGLANNSSINLVLNEGVSFEKVFDNIDIHSVSTNDVGGFEAYDTFKQFRARTLNQDSGLLGLDTTNDFNPTIANDTILGRWKKNHFQVAIPRDKQDNLDNDLNQWKTASRLKSKYLEVDLIYPNLDNNKLTTNFIEYSFRLIAR